MPATSRADDTASRRRHTAEAARRLRRYIDMPYIDDGAGMIETLVATILSQNTSDLNSNRAYLQLRNLYETWEEVASADREELKEVIRPAGLADQKSRTIIDALTTLKERHGTLDPEIFQTMGDDDLIRELTSVKGVGLKTASCVLMFSLGRDVCAVDTHVHRVANRLGLVSAGTPDATFHALRPLLPKGEARQFHVDMIRFGRRICKAQRPHCFECPLFDICDWEEKEGYAAAGLRGPRPVSGDALLLDVLKR